MPDEKVGEVAQTTTPAAKEPVEKKPKVKERKSKEKTSSAEPAAATPKPEDKAKIHTILKVLIITMLILTLVAGAFLLTRYLLLPTYQAYKIKQELNKDLPKKEVKKKANNPDKKATQAKPGLVYEIKDITVNPYASDGRRFVIVELALETYNQGVLEELKARDFQVRDLLIKYLRSCSAEQILNIDFQEVSRKELIGLINRRLTSGQIDSLYFTMLVVQ
jgi:flagellar basal body-associated protein FliL